MPKQSLRPTKTKLAEGPTGKKTAHPEYEAKCFKS